MFENNDFSKTLTRLRDRTKKLAEEWFEAECPWRIRVGGTKGPESMLLPAFDALGMPYIPSSTLRGIARAMAVKDLTMTETEIKEIFGDINPESSMGQVIFLDAYPLPGDNKQGGLMPDMANSIWKWEGMTPPVYNTNPNICISLKNPTFVIGLRRGLGCSDDTLQRVKMWLINGLNQGIGSRVNSGYGTLKATVKLGEKITKLRFILSIDFELQGQLIHGRQRFDGWKRNDKDTKWKSPGIAEAEVRAIAFRSMLRYWFRSLALGVLPSKSVRNLELEIFGGIEPNPTTGLFRLEVEVTGKIDNEITEQAAACLSGKLIVRSSSHQLAILNQSPGLDNLSLEERQSRIEHKRKNLINLLKTLTWLMFHLGGVGQGARRPCYKRTGHNPTPLWRGSTLILYPENENDEFWKPPYTLAAFHQLFQKRLGEFYTALKHFNRTNIDSSNPRTVTATTNWAEAVDRNCSIVVCQGKGSGKNGKGHALSVLHSPQLFFNGDYDKQLCGGVNPSIPSPVWIREIKDTQENYFHVVTVFGATSGKRQTFLEELKKKSSSNCLQIWPLANP
ncbi:RAMP superfamily CRISPR-associated protein [Microcoleus sp. Pol11C3]|uniref:RAMP superfamily CRISPR-associated protein n=1 Tax=Microcoleus sp. Pol11C3 TaxID=3055390 RepID=UPI002FCFCEED